MNYIIDLPKVDGLEKSNNELEEFLMTAKEQFELTYQGKLSLIIITKLSPDSEGEKLLSYTLKISMRQNEKENYLLAIISSLNPHNIYPVRIYYSLNRYDDLGLAYNQEEMSIKFGVIFNHVNTQKMIYSVFGTPKEDNNFKTALLNTQKNLDEVIINFSPTARLYHDQFVKINTKLKTLNILFGDIDGMMPDSIDYINTEISPSFLGTITIEKYKKINNLKIDLLNKINIFAGGNNLGKSTIAEIFYLIAKGTDPLGVTDVVRIRRKGDNNYSNAWLSEYLKFNLPLLCTYTIFKSDENPLSIEHNKFSIELNDINNTYSGEDNGLSLKKIDINLNDKATSAEIYQRKFLLTNNFKQSIPVTYITSQTTYKHLIVKDAWYKVVNHIGGKDLLIEFLRTLFIPNLKDINYADDNKDGLFLFELNNGTIQHLFDYGDGVQRCFALAVQAFSSKNGFFIIDEIENGIHHSKFGGVISFLFKIQEVLNLQIFITTHSLEALESFVKDENQKIVSYHHLYERNDVIKIESYKGSKYKFALEEAGVDLRGY